MFTKDVAQEHWEAFLSPGDQQTGHHVSHTLLYRDFLNLKIKIYSDVPIPVSKVKI